MSSNASMQTKDNNVARSLEGMARLANPIQLLAEWKQLLIEHNHLHPPEAARLLDVPESALVACRIGTGAHRLNPDIQQLLVPIADWGKVLCAFSNQGGHHMPLDEVVTDVEGDAFLIIGKSMQASIDWRAIKDAYLFVDTDDGHGTTRSLQFFDATGRAIFKVLILHKTGFSDAETYVHRYLSDNQLMTVALADADDPVYNPHLASLQVDPDNHEIEQAIPSLINDTFGQSGQYHVELVADYARVIWHGQLNKARIDDKMFHLHEKDIRSHFYLGAITSAYKSDQGAVVLNGQQGRLIRIVKGESNETVD